MSCSFIFGKHTSGILIPYHSIPICAFPVYWAHCQNVTPEKQGRTRSNTAELARWVSIGRSCTCAKSNVINWKPANFGNQKNSSYFEQQTSYFYVSQIWPTSKSERKSPVSRLSLLHLAHWLKVGGNDNEQSLAMQQCSTAARQQCSTAARHFGFNLFFLVAMV